MGRQAAEQTTRATLATRTDTSAPPSDRISEAYTHARSALVAMVLFFEGCVGSKGWCFKLREKAKLQFDSAGGGERAPPLMKKKKVTRDTMQS